ncbi:hypothetical protein KSX_74270 [Ktedonospora formicarum]|uniref:Uncharacterized protein n=2 Tax=Ktedonospora formicarum TaxID=2778364 RepID=A0A8J3IBX9_9CHLR|nr:hypothetical protein KSX_74270 [Ktedonospora formicarum]
MPFLGSDTRHLNMGYKDAFNEAAEAAAQESAFDLFQANRGAGSQEKMRVNNARVAVRVKINETSFTGAEQNVTFNITVKTPAKVETTEANGLVGEARRQAEALRKQFIEQGLTGSHEVLVSVAIKQG